MRNALIGLIGLASVACGEAERSTPIVLDSTVSPTAVTFGVNQNGEEVPAISEQQGTTRGKFNFSACGSTTNRIDGDEGFPVIFYESTTPKGEACGVKRVIDYFIAQDLVETGCSNMRPTLAKNAPNLKKENRDDPGVRCRNATLCFAGLREDDDRQAMVRAWYSTDSQSVTDGMGYVYFSQKAELSATDALYTRPGTQKCIDPEAALKVTKEIVEKAGDEKKPSAGTTELVAVSGF